MQTPKKPFHLHTFDAIGTAWSIQTDFPLSDSLKTAIRDEISQVNREYSRFVQTSLVSQLAQNGGSATFSHGIPELFELYDTLYRVTDGQVTPLIGNILNDLGYDARYSFTTRPIRPLKDYQILSHQNQTITLSEPAMIDVGAAGKGYLIDRVSAIISRDHTSFTVDGSGDLYSRGVSQTVALEHPKDPSLAIGHIVLKDAALCASATTRRAWGDGLHHIINPSTAQPVRDITATWVLANSALVADGLATALFFTKPENLARHFDFGFVTMYADGSVRYSPNSHITLYE